MVNAFRHKYPARFSELLDLKFAGNDRNVFRDSTRRNFEIYFKYSESQAFPSIVRNLDKFAPAYLLHFVIERMMTREYLSIHYSTFSRNLFNDLKGNDCLQSLFGTQIDNGDIGDFNFSHNIIPSFLFLSPSTDNLISREMRHVMCAVIRECVPVEKESFMIGVARKIKNWTLS